MDERIRVDVTRTGGFGGLTTSGSADTGALPADDGRELSRLVGDLDLDALRAAPAAAARSVPDAFQYDVLISRGGGQVRVRATDPDLPSELRPLVRFVLQRRT